MSTPAARSRIPIAAVDREYASLRADVLGAVTSVFDGCRFILGPRSRRSKKTSAAIWAARTSIGCANGTDALVLALRALDVGPGDEVIVPAFTFVATAEAVRPVGATPGVRRHRARHVTIDPARPPALVGKRTRAIAARPPLRALRRAWTPLCELARARRASQSSRTRRRPSARSGGDRRPGRSATSPASASIRPRTWAGRATAAW